MIDPGINNKPVTIYRGSRGGGMFQLPVSRLEEVHAVLDRHAVPYWDSAVQISSEGEPPFTSIHLSVKADVDLVQRLLDSLP